MDELTINRAQLAALYGLGRRFPRVRLRQGTEGGVLVGDDENRLWLLDHRGAAHRLSTPAPA